MKAVEKGDYEQAYHILSDYREDYQIAQAEYKTHSVSSSLEEKYAKAKNSYYKAFDYIYKSEIHQILAEMDEEDAIDKIVFLLDEIPVDGEKISEGKHRKSETGEWSSDGILFTAYVTWVQHYNELCNSVLTLAINRKYKNLARHILMHYVDNIEIIEGEYNDGKGKKVKGETIYQQYVYVDYVKTDYNNACKKYEDAVKLGLFD